MGRAGWVILFVLAFSTRLFASAQCSLIDFSGGRPNSLLSAGATNGLQSVNAVSTPTTLLMPGDDYYLSIGTLSQRYADGTEHGYYAFNFNTGGPIVPGDNSYGPLLRIIQGSFSGGPDDIRSRTTGEFSQEITQARNDGAGSSLSLDAGQATTFGNTSASGNGKSLCQVSGNPNAFGVGPNTDSAIGFAFRVNVPTSWSLTAVLEDDNGEGQPGSAPNNPVLPDPNPSGSGSSPHVSKAPSHGWVDPPVTDGYVFNMTSDSLFTKIADFPPGFDAPFTVSVGNQMLGQFAPGQSVDFSAFPGGGVSTFEVSGITPNIDGGDAMAFPIQLEYSTPTADFNMTPLPEPTCGAALAVASIAFARRRRPQSGHPE